MKTCSSCGEHKGMDDFAPRKNSRDGRRHQCRECVRCYKRGHYQANKEAYKGYFLKNNYGITLDQHAAMLAEQDGRCRICGEATDLVVDHDHSTGAVRGLLCQHCNIGIGYFADDISRLLAAVQYLSGNVA